MRLSFRGGLLLVLFITAAPLGAGAGQLTFQPKVVGSTSGATSYRLADGLHVDIEWKITATTVLNLAPPGVVANEPERVPRQPGTPPPSK